MNDTPKPGDPPDAPAPALQADPERRLEERAEQWGRDLEKKIDRFERQLPPPLSALLDAVCLGLVLPAAGWLLAKPGWIPMPTWKMVGAISVVVFLASLAIRTIRKPSGPGA